MNVLLFLFIVFLLCGLLAWLLNSLHLPSPWDLLMKVALVFIAMFVLLGLLMGGIPVPTVIK